MILGIGIGINRFKFAGGFSGSYNDRVLSDGGVIEGLSYLDNVNSILQQASWLLVPSGYKEGKVYAEFPSNGNGDLSFSRTSDAWRTYSDGSIKRTTWNLLQYSEDFSNAAWTKSLLTPTYNATKSPTGTITATKIAVNNGVSTSYELRTTSVLTVQTGQVYTWSIYVKAAGWNFVDLTAWTADDPVSTFDLSNGTFVSEGGPTHISTIQSIGDGWYRIAITRVATTNTAWLRVKPKSTSAGGTGNGVDGIYIWGAQLVEGYQALPYFPTTNRQNVSRLSYMYSPAPALLLEPQRTNLALYSEQFENASWVKTRSILYSNVALAPNNTNSADLLESDSTQTNGSWVRQTLTAFTGAYVLSVYAKQGTSPYLQVRVDGIGGVIFNLSDGTIKQQTSATGQIQSIGNGWYRCSILVSASASTNILYLVGNSSMNTTTWATTQGDNLYIWGAQLEAGSFVTTYIPTTSATVTRVADTFSRNNIYTNGFITSSGGTWYVELKNNVAYVRDNAIGIHIGDNIASNNGNQFIFRYGNPGRATLYKYISGVATLLYVTGTDAVKLLIKWNGTTADIFANGTKVVSATAFTTTIMEYLIGEVSGPFFIQSMALFSTPLSDAQCTALTTINGYPTATEALSSISVTPESSTCMNNTINTLVS